jgi:hypothetical protein
MGAVLPHVATRYCFFALPDARVELAAASAVVGWGSAPSYVDGRMSFQNRFANW